MQVLQFILSIFWNSEQRRLRAFWRLAVQTFAYLLWEVGITIVSAIAERILPDGSQGLIPLLGLAGRGLGILITVWLAGRLLDRRRLAGFGLHLGQGAWWLDLGFGLFLGAFLMALIFLVELAAGWVTVVGTFASAGSGFLPGMVVATVAFVLVGFYEELWSRGYQLRNMAEGLRFGPLSPAAAVILADALSAAIFGLLHAANPNATLISTINIALAGAILLGLGMLLTGSLAIPIGVHITWNLFQGNVFGFPVSGMTLVPATVFRIEQGGPALWTGGSFGPEAGLIGLLAMLAGGLLTALWVRWRRGRVRVAGEVAVAEVRAPRAGDDGQTIEASN